MFVGICQPCTSVCLTPLSKRVCDDDLSIICVLELQATAQLDLKAKELAAHLQKMGVGLGGLGKTLATRTSDLFDQVGLAA